MSAQKEINPLEEIYKFYNVSEFIKHGNFYLNYVETTSFLDTDHLNK